MRVRTLTEAYARPIRERETEILIIVKADHSCPKMEPSEGLTNLRVRRAHWNDIPVITEHNRAMAWETERKVLDPEQARSGVESVLKDPGKGFYLVILLDGSLIGQCMVTFEWSDWRNGNFWWVQSVYVAEEYRKKGVFNRLFQELEHLARNEADTVGLRLYVEEGNTIAQEAYRHLGMSETAYCIFEKEFRKEEYRRFNCERDDARKNKIY
jgi:GNAT superfamily N-acetyltransferase